MGRTRQAIRELTPRQREVLALVAKGHTNAEIADLLGITLAGAKWHVSELLMRLDVESREDLADFWAQETGIRGRLGRFAAALGGLVPLKAAAGVVGGLALLSGVGVAVAVMVSLGGTNGGNAASASATELIAAATATTGAAPTLFVLPGVTPPTNPMAGATPVSDQGALTDRPLVLPKLKAGESCPVSPLSRVAEEFGLAQGMGPVYVVGLQLHADKAGQSAVNPATLHGDISSWGLNKSLYIADPSYSGPLLIRGARLDGTGQVRFFGDTETDGLALPATNVSSSDSWQRTVLYTAVPNDGCYGLQVDGTGFREIIVFKTQLCNALGPSEGTTPIALPRCT